MNKNMNNLKILVIGFIITGVLFACCEKKNTPVYNWTKFHDGANAALSLVAQNLAITQMDSVDSVALEKIVKSDLKLLRNDKKLIGSFHIGNYFLDDIDDIDFSFVTGPSGKFHFLYLPQMLSYKLGSKDIYTRKGNHLVELIDSVSCTVKNINAVFVNELFNQEITSTDEDSIYNNARELIGTAFPSIGPETKLQTLNDSLNKYSVQGNKVTKKFVDSLIATNSHDSSFSLRSNLYGFTMFFFKINNARLLKVDIYFIPHRKRLAPVRM
jgi:hypothetical protein